MLPASARFYTSGMEQPQRVFVITAHRAGHRCRPGGGPPPRDAVLGRRHPLCDDDGGIVEKFAGDAVLAGFSVAQAHEDDAERAIRAGLGILEGMERLGLEARIGIESGEVVVDSTESTFATGEAVNLAARLQQAAGPGEILIGPGAQSLAGGRSRLRPSIRST